MSRIKFDMKFCKFRVDNIELNVLSQLIVEKKDQKYRLVNFRKYCNELYLEIKIFSASVAINTRESRLPVKARFRQSRAREQRR